MPCIPKIATTRPREARFAAPVSYDARREHSDYANFLFSRYEKFPADRGVSFRFARARRVSRGRRGKKGAGSTRSFNARERASGTAR